MESDVLILPPKDIARLAQAVASRASGKPVRVGLMRDAESRKAMGPTPIFPGIEIMAFDLDTDGAFADFDISTQSARIAAEMEAGVQAFLVANRPDVVVEATGRALTGAMICQAALESGYPVVSLNPRTDLAVGHYLRHRAHEKGLRYVFWQPDSVRAGLDLKEALEASGIEIVSLGATLPASGAGEQPLSDADISAVMIEMACLANATGISLDRPGMNGQHCRPEELAGFYRPLEEGGIFAVPCCVDYAVLDGLPAGVYAVAKAQETDGKSTAYRTHFTPISSCAHSWLAALAEVLEDGAKAPDLAYRPVADVCAIALRDVKPGERLAGAGAADYRGIAMRVDEIRWRESIPIGLLEGAMAKQIIEPDEPIVLENCVIDHTSRLYALRGLQEKLRLAS